MDLAERDRLREAFNRSHSRECGFKAFLPGAIRGWRHLLKTYDCPYRRPLLRADWTEGWFWAQSLYLRDELEVAEERIETLESAVRAAGRLLDGKTFAIDDPQVRTLAAALRLLEGDDDDA